MVGRHADTRRGHLIYLAVLGVIGLAAALLFHVMVQDSGASADGQHTLAAPGSSTSVSRAKAPSAPSRSSSTSHPTQTASRSSRPPTSPSTTASSQLAARDKITDLIASRPTGGVSVSAYNTVTGARLTMGADSGMVTASVVKVQLLETMLLQHQRSGKQLSSYEDSIATAMIEHSSNSAAESVFEDDGDRPGVVGDAPQLGLSTAKTIAGSTDYWGLTTTSASQQIILLTNLVETSSPLDAASQKYALNLMRNVEPDQRWGVGVAADHGTTFANKNGWLNIDSDGGLWAVNSNGVLTVDGDQVLISVMSQHNQNESVGITLIQALAQAAAAAVT